jgi:hypothetical protein
VKREEVIVLAKFVQVNGGDRGRPRTNKGDKSGNVRITVAMPGTEGNMTRSLTVEGKVSEVYNALLTLVKKAEKQTA